MFADERNELLGCNQECNRVNETEHPQNEKAGQPVIISAGENFSEEFFVRPHPTDGGLLKPDPFEDRDETRVRAKGIPSRIDF